MNDTSNLRPTISERLAVQFYHRTSRKDFLTQTGRQILKCLGITLLPLLPINRIVQPALAQGTYCNSTWYLCGIWGRLCNCSACTGGSLSHCPSCAVSDAYWDDCCYQGTTGVGIRYYDCCATVQECPFSCSTCEQCQRGKDQGPWCPSGKPYMCSVAQSTNLPCL
jgi:hypothetical protein